MQNGEQHPQTYTKKSDISTCPQWTD